MPFYVYILYSERLDKYYIGHSANMEDRIYRHRNSGSKFTKSASDWKVVHTQIVNSKSEAYKREMEIKSKKSRRYIEWLINSGT